MTRGRTAAAVAVGLLAAAAGLLALRHGDDFLLEASFRDASGLRKDFHVKLGGVPVGRVEGVGLTADDVAIVRLRLDRSALPIGAGARATIRPSSLLGEHHVALTRGDTSRPLASGAQLPLAQTATAVELDQVLAALDESTRTALGVFLSESGDALVGRGTDLATTLARLPGTLEETTTLLRDLRHDNGELSRLVAESDRLVAPLAGERRALARLVATAAGALRPIAAGRDDFGAAIGGGARAVTELRSTLRGLRSLSRAVVPAADGLRATAAPFATTIAALRPFGAAASPLLAELRRAAPRLRALGLRATPTTKALRPVATSLDQASARFEPVSRLLDRQTDNIIGFAEAYTRALHESDGLGHIYNSQTVYANLSDAARALARLRDRRAAAPAARRRPARPLLDYLLGP